MVKDATRNNYGKWQVFISNHRKSLVSMDIARYGAMDWKLPSKLKGHKEIVGSNGSSLSILILLSALRVTFMLIIMKPTTVL